MNGAMRAALRTETSLLLLTTYTVQKSGDPLDTLVGTSMDFNLLPYQMYA